MDDPEGAQSPTSTLPRVCQGRYQPPRQGERSRRGGSSMRSGRGGTRSPGSPYAVYRAMGVYSEGHS